MPIEAQAESFPFVQKAAVTEHNEQPLLVVQLQTPPTDWKQQLQPLCATIVQMEEIPVDPRHNSKILRSALKELVKKKI